MRMVTVIRSYVGRKLGFGPITIAPWKFVEVNYADYQALPQDVQQSLNRAKLTRDISIQLVADGNPVDEMNESTVVRVWRESVGG